MLFVQGERSEKQRQAAAEHRRREKEMEEARIRSIQEEEMRKRDELDVAAKAQMAAIQVQ